MSKLLSFASLAIALVGNAFGYGNAGHQTVGTIAERTLEGTRALKEIRLLLKPDEGLDRAATWADRAKLPEKYLDAEMLDYIASNPEHNTYHYSDIPFQQKTYRDGLTGTNKRDIVHVLELCIQVLQAPENLKANPLKIDKRVALMLITHLIGDLHQPLHVGSSYIDDQNQFVDPETGAKGQMDAGGNYLFLKMAGKTNLHGYWDTQTVKDARDHLGIEDFPAALVKAFPSKPEWDATGPVISWPAQWATDALSVSKSCFEGLKLGDRIPVPMTEKREAHFEWQVTLPEGYAEKSRNIVELQLAKAGYRLAAVFKAVWPERK